MAAENSRCVSSSCTIGTQTLPVPGIADVADFRCTLLDVKGALVGQVAQQVRLLCHFWNGGSIDYLTGSSFDRQMAVLVDDDH